MDLPPIKPEDQVEAAGDKQVWIFNFNMDIGSIACGKASSNSEGTEVEVRGDTRMPRTPVDKLAEEASNLSRTCLIIYILLPP